jgi:hypothetical protein
METQRPRIMIKVCEQDYRQKQMHASKYKLVQFTLQTILRNEAAVDVSSGFIHLNVAQSMLGNLPAQTRCKDLDCPPISNKIILHAQHFFVQLTTK